MRTKNRGARRAVVGGVSAMVFALGACGGDDAHDGGGASASSTTSIPTEATTAPPTTTSTTVAVPAAPALAWSTEIEGGHDRVVVGPAQVFVLDSGDRVRALDRETGALLWDTDAYGSDASFPTAIGDDLFLHDIVNRKSVIRLVDGATGHEAWSVEADSTDGLSFVGDPGRYQFAIVPEPFGRGFRRLDLATGELSEPLPGNPRAFNAERVVTVTENSTLNFFDLATMTPAGPPVELGSSFGLDALAMSGPNLLMINGQELKLVDAAGTSLATGRVASLASLVTALSGDRVLVTSLGGPEVLTIDGSRFDTLWHGTDLAIPLRDDDGTVFLLAIANGSFEVIATAGAEPVVLGTIDVGGTPPAEARPRVAGGRLYLTAGGEHMAYELEGLTKVWSLPSIATDQLAPFADGVVRATSANNDTTVELYR